MDESLREPRGYPKLEDIHPSEDDIKRAESAWDQLNEMATHPENPQWKLVIQKPDVTVYSRPSHFSGGPTEWRIDGIIKAPLKSCFSVLNPSITRVDWDKTLRVFDEVYSSNFLCCISFSVVIDLVRRRFTYCRK